MTSRIQPSADAKSARPDTQPSAAHTPGPWDYVPGTENHGPYVTTDFGNTVADLYTMSRPAPWSREEPKPVPFLHEMAEANARLIAAAPDLLWVCQAVVERAVSASDLRVFALAAISKATGAEQ